MYKGKHDLNKNNLMSSPLLKMGFIGAEREKTKKEEEMGTVLCIMAG